MASPTPHSQLIVKRKRTEKWVPMNPFVIISGLSGAGHSTVLRAFEDMGYQAIDNIPLRYLSDLPDIYELPVAVSIDTRTIDFDPQLFIQSLNNVKKKREDAHFIFLECEESILLRRYKQSRRPHPLGEKGLVEALKSEFEVMRPLRHHANHIIDTSHRTIEQTTLWLRENFSTEKSPRLILQLISFSYHYGIPPEADIVLDGRFLQNPFYIDILKEQDGRDHDVQEYLKKDPNFSTFVDNALNLIKISLDGFRKRGRSYVTIACGCTGGKHRSVFLIETFSKLIQDDGIVLKTYHKQLSPQL